jgi:hypothetical protein
MNKKLLTLIILFITVYSVKAQDSFVAYNNAAEKNLIENAKLPREYLKLALVSETEEPEAEQALVKADGYIKQLGWGENAGQKPEKRLKDLFQKIHAVFLKKYEEEASFKQLFDSGQYQCVGASILYAYILEQYNIPYQIKETPTHVYVVAYPESYNILLETTDPSSGYFVPDAKSKEKYINELVKEKYLDDAYVKKVGIDQAFNEFFYSKTSITLKEAVGLLYYNRAIEKSTKEKTDEAYSAISKADILYPAKKHDFLKYGIMDDMIKNFKFNDMKEWQALVFSINRESTVEENKKFLVYEFNDLIQNKLWKTGQKDKVDSVYTYLMANVKDTGIKSDVEDEYLMESGRYAYTAHKLPEAKQYMEKAYSKNPNNAMSKSLLLAIEVQEFTGQMGSKTNIDALDTWTAKYPTLKQEPEIRTLYLYNYTYLAYYAFQKMDGVNGNSYMKKMTDMLDSPGTFAAKDDNQIGGVFALASVYYYQKFGKQRSMDILNQGLKYAPNHPDLVRKINVFKASK